MNGNVSLDFTHASDYVVIIGDNMEGKTPDTGDNAPIIPFVLLMLAGCTMVAIGVVKRKNAK